MRVGLQSWGTEGDLRPFLALSQALRRAGHDVRLMFTGVEGRDVSSLVESAGVETRLVDDGYFVANREALTRRAREGLKLGSPRKQFEMIVSDLMDPVVDSMLDAARDLATDCDVIVGHFLAHTAAAAAEERSRPYVMLALQPVFASAHYPPAGAPALGRLLNPLAWKLANHIMSGALLHRMNATRARCGLRPSPRFVPAELGSPRRVLVGVSPSLFPRPGDWSAHLDVCGFLALEEPTQKWRPEPRVQAFLDASAPVYLSFGSMFGMDERQAAESVAVFATA